MAGLAALRDRVQSRADSLEVAQETLRNVVTSQIYEMMGKQGTNKAELAKEMRVSRAAVSNLLSGDRNFTIGKLAHVAYVLGFRPEFHFRRGTDAAWMMQYTYERLMETERIEVRRRESTVSEIRTKSRSFERFVAQVPTETYR